jgi:DNA repair protein RadD
MSGTDWISNNDDPNSKLYLESICSNRVFNLNASSLIEQKYLVPAKILFYSVPEWPEKLPDSYLAIYSQYVVKNELRNQIIVDVTKKLIQMGRKVLILVRHISHGKELAAKLYDVPLYFVSGAVGGLEREQVKEDFQNGIYKCLIASSVFDVGINIPELDGLILAGGGKSTIKSLQRIGRVIRTSENKKDAIIVDFLDNAKYLLQHSYARITAYESESQFRIKFPKDFDQSRIKRSRKIINKIS